MATIRGRFPRTPHIVNGPLTGQAVTRDDLTLTAEEADLFLFADGHGPDAVKSAAAALASSDAPQPALRLVVEEKLDGANLGLGLADDGGTILAQNRSHYVNGESAPQWAGLPRFLEEHRASLLQLFYALPEDPEVAAAIRAPLSAHTAWPKLGPGAFGQPPAGASPAETAPSEEPACDWRVFGEWLAYQHSVFYDALPAPFVIFDVYHVPTQRFLAAELRDRLVADHCPLLATSRRVYSGPLVPRPPKGSTKAQKGARNTADATAAPTAGPVTSWDAFFALWHRKPSGFFATGDSGPKGRNGASEARQMEGVVLRVDDVASGVQLLRCKAVHDEFTAAIDEHWRKQAPVKNLVARS